MPTNDETFYLQAMQEVESENRHEGLWAKALTLETGNIEQAKYRYVKLRVEQLQLSTNIIENSTLQPVSLDSIPPKAPKSRDITVIPSSEDDKKSPLYSFASHPAKLTQITIISLEFLVVMTGIALMSDFMQLNMIENIDRITVEAAEANDKRVNIVDWTHIIVGIMAWITVLVWKYRTNKNCHGFGTKGMRFTPGWAVGWHFVPFMNIFRPYQVMQEIWKVSTDPMTWQNQRGSTLVKWWWFSFLVSAFFGKYSAKLSMKSVFKEESLDQLGLITTATIFSNFALIACTILTILMISAIRDKQNKLFQI